MMNKNDLNKNTNITFILQVPIYENTNFLTSLEFILEKSFRNIGPFHFLFLSLNKDDSVKKISLRSYSPQ